MLRRQVIKGMALMAPLGAVAAVIDGPLPRRPDALVVFDSDHATSREFAGSAVCAIDLVDERTGRWAQLRHATPTGAVMGLTTWSDFVQVRGVLEARRMRVQFTLRRGDLYYWHMV